MNLTLKTKKKPLETYGPVREGREGEGLGNKVIRGADTVFRKLFYPPEYRWLNNNFPNYCV